MHRRKSREAEQRTNTEEDDAEEEEIIALPWFTMPILNYFTFTGVVLLALNSSNNAHTPRAIFEAPFLTKNECASVITLFNKVPSSRDNGLTLIENNNSSQDAISFLEDKLNGRLGPLIERVSINFTKMRDNEGCSTDFLKRIPSKNRFTVLHLVPCQL